MKFLFASTRCPLVGLVAMFTLGSCSKVPLTVQTALEQDYAFKDVLKVPVVLGVMSACPDAILCESVFDRVLQQVGEKVDISLTFIGRPNASEPDFGVTCMHGRNECAGNVQELCATNYTPTSVWWSFVQCQNFQGRNEVGKPETALKCADAAGIDWANSAVGACAGIDGSGTGKEGISLLRDNVNVTKSLGIEKSCTILINGKAVCVRDGSWKDCDGGHTPADFVRQINEEYARLNDDDVEVAV